MKVVSFNVNSIRARLHQLAAVIERHDPHIIGLQETKVTDEEFPLAEIHELGYQVGFHGQKGHYGVALLFRDGLQGLQKGFDHDGEEAQRRFIQGEFDVPGFGALGVVNCYFPQGESRDHPSKFPNKEKFYGDLRRQVEEKFRPDQPLIVMGDMNVAPEDCDIGIGEDNRKAWLRKGKCSFLPEEREWLQTLCDWGLADTYRKHYPGNAEQFSWFDYRSRGFEREPKRGLRIDHILATPVLMERCVAAGIDYEIRGMEKPSDHCPVWAEFY
ncbi:exodeoxyribonuclease III [Gilvimarinus sp. F26214L]|uniref:exodeoxyribonuclease III n=1 Tax=Gilvimarinus sp. DZF01 TaxID=3461371 RepID=UPI004045B4F1